ncbi:MAG: radical SAM protein [Nanoarchaeota archaeon]
MKKIRVLLIQPPYTIYKKDYKRCMPPLGLAYIAAILEEHNFDVKILDAYVEGFENEKEISNDFVLVGLSDDDIFKEIVNFKPEFVGVSGMFSTQDKNVLKVCSLVKQFNPGVPLFVGGSHPTYAVRDVLMNKDIDFVILGEGEFTTLNLIQKIMNNEDVSTIEGLGYKKDGIFVNPKLNYIQDLDSLPDPARHLLNMEKYISINLPQSPYTMKSRVTQIVTSRGCSAKCVFCTTTNFWGNVYRVRSAKSVVDEIEMLINKYNVEEIHFCDDNFSLNRARTNEIMDEIIKRDLKFVWCTPQGIAVWALDEKLIEKFAKTGCYQLTFAIESGNQWVETNIMNKPLILSKVKRLVDKAHELGISIHGFFVVGMPGETKEQIMETFEFPIKNDFDSASFFIATPCLGSELYEICLEKGLLKEDFRVDETNYKIGNIHTEEFTPEELQELTKDYTKIFNEGLAQRNPGLYYKKYGKSGFVLDPIKGYFKIKREEVEKIKEVDDRIAV